MTKIVIDPGHGGVDPGASGNGIIEKNKNLDISTYMYNSFKELGIPVQMTRTTDETLTPTERTDKVLSAFGNNKDVIVISNHINEGGGDGAEVIYALRNSSTLANKVLEELNLAGQNSRKAYQRRLPSDTSKDYYFIHRNTGVTQPIIVEYGFLDSPGDDVANLKNNWNKYAEAVVKAVAEYSNVPYDQIIENVYIVKSGDSLWSIAKKFNISVTQLKNLNNLTSNTLKIGQQLKVSEITQPLKENQYVVKSGDNLYDIARNYGVTVDDIKNANNLTTNSLSIGQILTIPISEIKNVEDYITYTVKEGDNLYSIANSYKLTPTELMNYNNLTNTNLSINQILKIPVAKEGVVTYIVKSGDSLYSIARNYNTTVDSLKIKNNLTSTILDVGQILTI